MVKCLTNQKEFIVQLLNTNEDKEIDEELWGFMDEFVKAFQPLYVFTKKIQEIQLTMGDFYFLWLECELQLKHINNFYTNLIFNSMDIRKTKLFDNIAFLSALYMDPRFSFAGSNHLNEIQREKAKVCIKFKNPANNTNIHICRYNAYIIFRNTF